MKTTGEKRIDEIKRELKNERLEDDQRLELKDELQELECRLEDHWDAIRKGEL